MRRCTVNGKFTFDSHGRRPTSLPCRTPLPQKAARGGAGAGALGGLLGGLGGAITCLCCLSAIGLIGLWATFIPFVAYFSKCRRRSPITLVSSLFARIRLRSGRAIKSWFWCKPSESATNRLSSRHLPPINWFCQTTSEHIESLP